MKQLVYIANMRFPTEKAHGLQITQNCEAFADAGLEVTLWIPRRANTDEMRAVTDAWAYYGVKHNFEVRQIPCVDLMPLVSNQSSFLSKLIFLLQEISFALMAAVTALYTRADIYYSRDVFVLLLVSLLKPRYALAYEVHRRMNSRAGRWMQGQVARRVGTVVAITPHLQQAMIELGAQRTMLAHDGIRRDRFANVPDQVQARHEVGWPAEAFIVGYVGRLHTMSMDKGVGTLVEALGQVEGAALALVGGPDDMAEVLRRQWIAAGLPESHFLYAGHVTPDRVPLYLSAFDVCAMPHPFTPHFAYATSPLKLFEYMASRRAIVASNLPGWADVIRDGESALLAPPSDANALAGAITRLRDDPVLRERLADCAYTRVMAEYTWDARAQAILAEIGR